MKVDMARLRNLAEETRQRVEATAQQQRRTGQSWYRIENKGGEGPAAVYLYDMIGEWGITAQDFVGELRQLKGQAIDLHVNCEGGEVFDGVAIYESLRRHDGEITAYVEGIAASAASFVIQAADRVYIAARAKVMIHDAHGFAMGNARDMRAMADLLDGLSEEIANIYAERTGTPAATWREAMRAAAGGPDGSWYTAEQAVEVGLADAVLDSKGRPPADGAEARAQVRDDAPVHVQPHTQTPPPAARADDEPWWDPAAFAAMIDEIEHPPHVAPVPDGAALLAGFGALGGTTQPE